MTKSTRTIHMAANWKMFKTTPELNQFFDDFVSVWKGFNIDSTRPQQRVQATIAVPTILLHQAQRRQSTGELPHSLPIRIAAQNMHFAEEGAFTGETSARMLKDQGLECCILGHSERRQYFGETDDSVAQKTVTALKHDLQPIVCIGEQLQSREAGDQHATVTKQLTAVCESVTQAGLSDQADRIIWAYEPVWAIGTGLAATPDQAQDMHAHIRSVLSDKFSEPAAQRSSILYGGSTKPNNIADILANNDVDGALIGGASLKAESYAEMVRIACSSLD